MTTWRRRIRNAIGMGLIWGGAWLGAGLVLLLTVGGADVPFPLLWGLLGFLAGVAFSGVLGMVEGGHRVDQLSLLRVAGWGAVAGLLLAVLFVLAVVVGGDETLDLLVVGPVLALAGALTAAGSLAIARRAGDRGLHDAPSDAR